MPFGLKIVALLLENFCAFAGNFLQKCGKFPNFVYKLYCFNCVSSPHAAQSGEVYAIVERANKDVAIESLLNTFEEVWLSKHFELRLHQRMRDTGGQEVSHTHKHTHIMLYIKLYTMCFFYIV